jgi:hypothetical protein
MQVNNQYNSSLTSEAETDSEKTPENEEFEPEAVAQERENNNNSNDQENDNKDSADLITIGNIVEEISKKNPKRGRTNSTSPESTPESIKATKQACCAEENAAIESHEIESGSLGDKPSIHNISIEKFTGRVFIENWDHDSTLYH